MMWLLLSLIMNHTSLLGAETQCRSLNLGVINETKVETIIRDCATSNIKFKLPLKTKKNESIILRPKEENTFYCQTMMDQLAVINEVSKKENYTWSSKDHFSDLVSMSVSISALKFNSEQSKIQKKDVCNQYPFFKRIKIVKEKAMSKSLVGMREGGYLLYSSKMPTLYFIDKHLKKIQFGFNLNEDVGIEDALLNDNGELILLTTEGKGQKANTCLEKWDLITGSLIQEKCGMKDYQEQMLIDMGYTVRAYRVGKDIVLEKFNSEMKNSLIKVIKNTGTINLNSSFVVEN